MQPVVRARVEPGLSLVDWRPENRPVLAGEAQRFPRALRFTWLWCDPKAQREDSTEEAYVDGGYGLKVGLQVSCTPAEMSLKLLKKNEFIIVKTSPKLTMAG